VASTIQRAAASQKRINEFLLQEPAVKDGNEILEPVSGAVSFEEVDFVYPHTGIRALDGINIRIQPGEKIALIGKTGSGKSTIAQLLARMYDVGKGRIAIDGQDIRRFTLASLRRQIAWVPQDVFLFSETIASNILFGRQEAGIDQVQAAAAGAQIHHDIEAFPKGYETLVGERGVTLSGGQKQRVSIARALIKEAPIVIFDDCFSAVDAQTEHRIIQSLQPSLEGRTAIIITHRVFSLFQFDRILVLHEGKIVEEGTHENLISLNGYYKSLYDQQQQKESASI
jgi:ATP-binding cassette subfamily B protein